jgi:hypothetical protein
MVTRVVEGTVWRRPHQLDHARLLAGGWLIVSLLVSCSSDDPEAATPASSTTTPVDVAGEQLRLGEHDAARIEMPFPDWLAADESFLYVKLDSGAVNRVDPVTGAVVDTAEIAGEGGLSGSGCQGIGIGFDSIWTCHSSDVVRMGLNPFTEVSRIAAGKTASQGHLATGFDRVWVLQGDGSALAGVDPETEVVGEPFPLPVRGTDLAVGDDGIWIVSALDDAVLLVDPTDGTVRHRLDGLNGPAALSVVDEDVWVGDASAVHRIDPATGLVTTTIEGGPGRSGAVAADESGVWIRHGADVRHVDANSGANTSSFTLDLAGPSPGDMLVAFGSVWTSASEDNALFRVILD